MAEFDESARFNFPMTSVRYAWRSFLIRARARNYGRLRESRILSEVIGVALLADYFVRRSSVTRRMRRLVVAARRLQSPPLRRALQGVLRPWLTPDKSDAFRKERIGWDHYTANGIEQPALSTSVLLKAPGSNGELGILYCSFESNWIRLVKHLDARRFLKEYLLVGASSWSPPDYAAFATLSGLSDHPTFIGISNTVDVADYRLFEPFIKALPLLASDWTNPDHFNPKPRKSREIDILMVANWLKFKRHWLLFEALRKMDRRLRIVMVGRNAPGRTEREIRAEAKAFGVRQEIELLTNININQVVEHQCNARISVVFSGREGSCVSVAESLFADTPVAMMSDAHIGSKAYINSRTGMLAQRHELPRTLDRLLEGPDSLTPRAWALENITCHHSSRVLNGILHDYCVGKGLPWTQDIKPLEWHYVPRYVNEADEAEMAPAVERLHAAYGVSLIRYDRQP